MRRFSQWFIVLLAALGMVLIAPQVAAQGDTPPAEESPSADDSSDTAEGDTPSPDPAPDTPSTADELKAKGDTAMLDLRYDDALAAYQEAYALDPNPALLYNQGRAYQARGSYPKALTMLRRFQAEAPPELKARVPRLAELIAELEQRVTTLSVQVNVPGASIRVRNQPIGTSPLSATPVNSGAAKISASKAGYRVANATVTLIGGQAQTVKLVLVPLKTTGLLQVRAVAGSRVFVDGKQIGAVPADVELKPGKHRVVIRHDDYEEADTAVVMEAGTTRLHKVDLVKIPPVTERWWFWRGLGAVSTAAAFVVVAAVLEGPVEEGNIQPGAISAPLITVASF
jgi:hypothetical protein